MCLFYRNKLEEEKKVSTVFSLEIKTSHNNFGPSQFREIFQLRLKIVQMYLLCVIFVILVEKTVQST